MDPLQALFLIGLCYFICHMIFGEVAWIATIIVTAFVYLLHAAHVAHMPVM